MSAITVDASVAATIAALCGAAGQRIPDIVGPPGSTTRDLVWTPDLTSTELAAITDIVATGKSAVAINVADYQALKPFLTTMRALLGLSQSDFMALTQAQRDRMIFDNLSAIERVLLRMLRDG